MAYDPYDEYQEQYNNDPYNYIPPPERYYPPEPPPEPAPEPAYTPPPQTQPAAPPFVPGDPNAKPGTWDYYDKYGGPRPGGGPPGPPTIAPPMAAPAPPSTYAPPPPAYRPPPTPPPMVPNFMPPPWLQQLLSGGAGGATTTTTPSAPDPARQAFEQKIRDQVLMILNQNQQPLDTNAIVNSPEAQAFNTLQKRAMDRFRAQQAESRAGRGTGAVGGAGGADVGGALSADIMGGASQLAERTQAFESQLVAGELRNRRQQLMQALQLGAGLMSQDQEAELRRELSATDNALRERLGMADIGLRSFLGGGQLSLGLLSQLLNNQQFYDQLGYNLGGQEADLNRYAGGGFF